MADQVPVSPDESADVSEYCGGMVIDGVAASEALDSSGEILDVDGADISDLQNGLGVLNWEHENGAKDVIGKIIYAKKIFKREDCEDDRQREYWDQLELPFIYHQARLYDGAGHEAAKAVAAMVRDHAANKEPILVRFSIEGSTLEKDAKDPRRLAATVARRVAATIKPCNRSCHSGLVRDPNGSVAMAKSETGNLAPLAKTLAAGGVCGSPGELTGLAALQPEHLGNKWVAVSLGALRDYRDYSWDRQEFGRVLKHLLPEAPKEFFDSFMDVAEKIRVPKSSLRKSAEEYLSRDEFVGRFTLRKLEAILTAAATWIEYGTETQKSARYLRDNLEVLRTVMDLEAPRVLYRGYAVPFDDAQSSWKEGSRQIYRPRRPLEGWTASCEIARSFAKDHGWTDNPVAIVVATTERPKNVALAPSSKTARWFETELREHLSRKQDVHDRRVEREYLLFEDELEVEVVYKGFNSLKKNTEAPDGEPPMTLRGQPVPPNRHLTRPTFDEHSGILHTPKGSFPMYVPGRTDDPEVFVKALSDPQVEEFHGRAVENWARMRDALRAGKTAPEVVMHATLFSQLSPQTPVPVQELQYGHLVDVMRERGVDARDPKFPDLKQEWLSRDRPDRGPTHEAEYYQNLQGAKSWGKGGSRPPGSFQKFPLSSGKGDSVANYHRMHQGLTDLVNRHRTDGRSAARELMEHKVKFGAHQRRKDQVDPFPGIPVSGLAPKTTRYLFGMLGAENVVVPDTHVSRHLFGLDKDKDSPTIDYLKRVLWDERNTPVLEGIDRYYGRHHPAVRFLREHPKYGALFSDDEQALFPAFWRHWLAIPADERARGMRGQGFNAETDHTPFWRAVDPYVAKSEESVRWRLPAETAAQHDRWVREHGDVPALMLYFRYLAPKLMERESLNKMSRNVRERRSNLTPEEQERRVRRYAVKIGLHPVASDKAYHGDEDHQSWPGGDDEWETSDTYRGFPRAVDRRLPYDRNSFYLDHELGHAVMTPEGETVAQHQRDMDFMDPSAAARDEGMAISTERHIRRRAGIDPGLTLGGERVHNSNFWADARARAGELVRQFDSDFRFDAQGQVQRKTGINARINERARLRSEGPGVLQVREPFTRSKKPANLPEVNLDKATSEHGLKLSPKGEAFVAKHKIQPATPAQATHGDDAWDHEAGCDNEGCRGCASGVEKVHGSGSQLHHKDDCRDSHCGGACTQSTTTQDAWKNRVWSGSGFLNPDLDAKYQIRFVQHGNGPNSEWSAEVANRSHKPSALNTCSINIFSQRGGNPELRDGDLRYGHGVVGFFADGLGDLADKLKRHRNFNGAKSVVAFHPKHVAALAEAVYRVAEHVLRNRRDTKFVGFYRPWMDQYNANRGVR